MYKLFPKSSNGRDCLTQAAQTFEAMARLDLAGRVLLNLAQVEAEKQDYWRETAADFFALSGGKQRAIQMYLKLGEGKKQATQVKFLEKAAIVAREVNDQKALQFIEGEFTKMNLEPFSSQMIVEAAEEAFARSDYTKAFNTSKRIISRDGLPKNLSARARFVQARVLADEYTKQSTKARVEKIGIVLAMKTEKLEKAQKAMQSAINYGDGETSVKALQALGNLYLDYTKTVRGMQLPAGTPEADVAAFKGELEQLTVPMEEKGIEAMNLALDTAKKAQLRDGQIATLQKEVDRLNMKTDNAPAVTVSKPGLYVPKFSGLAARVAMIGVR
jgi:cellulose synthase operon protein C